MQTDMHLPERGTQLPDPSVSRGCHGAIISPTVLSVCHPLLRWTADGKAAFALHADDLVHFSPSTARHQAQSGCRGLSAKVCGRPREVLPGLLSPGDGPAASEPEYLCH